MAKAKPFIKWVGGKSQLIEQLDAQLPVDFCLRDKSIGNWDDVTYIEPFVGGGAMLFYMLSNFDCMGKNEEDNFFDVLYGGYNRRRIYEQNGVPNIICKNY